MNRVAFIPFAVCLCSFASAAQSDFKSFINNEDKLLSKAFANKDSSFFRKTAAPGFTITQGGKTFTAEQSFKLIDAQFAGCTSMKCAFKVVSAKSNGNTGTTKTQVHGEVTTKPGKDGKSHLIVEDETATATWVRIGKTWKIKSQVVERPTKLTVDGKPAKV